VTRFVFSRNTHQDESQVVSQTAGQPRVHCRRQSVVQPPIAYLSDILRRLPDHPINKIAELLPQNWRTPNS